MDSMYYGERKFPFGKVIRKPFLWRILLFQSVRNTGKKKKKGGR
jgi:hypothetical protein